MSSSEPAARRTSDTQPIKSLTEVTPTHRSKPSPLADPFQHETSSGSQESSSSSSDDVVGQFSFAPAIQKTVVTTTTTTTTHFPPFVMKGSKKLHELDPKLYPLATTPTPPSMRELHFNLGGKAARFSEADDGRRALDDYNGQQKRLRTSHGSVNTWETNDGEGSDFGTSSSAQELKEKIPQSPPTSSAFQAVDFTPPRSIGAAKRSSNRNLSRHNHLPSRQSSLGHRDFPRPHQSSSKLQIVQTSTPITPFAGRGSDAANEGSSATGRMINAISPEETPSGGTGGREVAQTLSPQPESSLERARAQSGGDEMARSEALINTPPVDSQPNGSRPRPTVLDTTSIQDVSLPSPSLSPVRAASFHHGYFDDAARDYRSDLASEKRHRRPTGLGLGLSQEDEPESQISGEDDAGRNSQFSMMNMSDMLVAFDAMPPEMQSYMMHQMLRRCQKPLLRVIADTVNPALKCDFLVLLPAELRQLIVSNLDIKSLCRAAQVSRRWREIIDTDEKIWKDLFDKEGFTLPPGELRRAIIEGWGWQQTSSLERAEVNLANCELTDMQIPSQDTSPDAQSGDGAASVGDLRRTKRKATGKLRASSRKIQKRKDTPSNEVAAFDYAALQKHLGSTDGPFAAAQVAKITVPHAEQGIEKLRNMTLYKSIYRRHHLIGQNWMQDRVKPRHLAFRAHGGHVVTCLEFDSDKIITGSDDQKINVYDTRTGALRKTLTGHEGGVWALKYEGNLLVSGSTDRTVRIWNIKSGRCVHVFQGHGSTVRCLLIVMPVEVGRSGNGQPIMMPKEPLIVTGSRDSTLRVWKLPKPNDRPAAPQNNAQTTANTFTPQSPYFVRTLTGHTYSVRAIAAHGDTLVSGSYDYTVRVWRISTGETVHRLVGHTQKVYSVVLDHERQRCISGSMDNFVKIWSLETGACLFNLDGHSSLVGLLDLQHDKLVSAAADFTLRIWDPDNGACRAVLSAHTAAITCFQHDAHKVVSGSDRNLKMWNARTGEFVRDLLSDLTGVWQVRFDETKCVAAVQRGTLTYIEILDFSAARDGYPEAQRGRRVVVNVKGEEVDEPDNPGSSDAEDGEGAAQ